MFPSALSDRAKGLLETYRRQGLRVATAESCTGGLVAACLTAIAGSSDVFDRGFVTYSNEAKMDLLGVPAALLEAHGAVSDEVARAMAEGALAHSRADVAVAITGIAGPGGGSEQKPVGLVFMGVARKGGSTVVERHVFPGDRSDVRRASLERALGLLEGAALAPPASAS
jgi:nicotinamide-nucleotide amidase